MKPALLLLAALLLASLAALLAADQPLQQAREAARPAHLAGALSKDEPQAIYTDDAQDSWNRIFHCLFTRTLKVRLTADFPADAPFSENEKVGVGKKVSQPVFERIESGDRAIEPLYPHEQFRADVSAAQLLAEPRFSRIHKALTDALAERAPRTPQGRALMQSDLWAAYDFLARDVSDWILKDAPIALFRERQAKLRKLLAPLIRKLALTPHEMKALPDNYAAGRKLPDLFGATSEWLEVQWFPEREHERAAMHRRVARVFIKPLVKPADKLEFLKGGRSGDFHGKVEATALIIQNLLVNADGNVVPSSLTYAVQTRTLGGRALATSFEEFELSRRALLKNPATGGLMDVTGLPAYLPGAGNDYSYAAPIPTGGAPIAVRPATRCAACHAGIPIFTFGIIAHPDAPAFRILVPAENERALFVAHTKMKTTQFKSLLADWK